MEKEIKKHSAVIAVWASVVAAGYLIPTLPILGTGMNFSLANILSPLSGIFFGPIIGALCTAIGGFIGNMIAPHTAWMGPFTFIIGTVTAFTTGCIAWNKGAPVKVSGTGNFIINGAIIVYFFGYVLWFTQEIGRSFIWFAVIFYGLGFLAVIAGFFIAGKFLNSEKKILKFLMVWICAFGGLVGGASIGNFFSLLLYETPKDIWKVLLIQSPIERALFASAAMIVGVPLLEGLNKIGIFVGPKEREEETGNREQGAGNNED